MNIQAPSYVLAAFVLALALFLIAFALFLIVRELHETNMEQEAVSKPATSERKSAISRARRFNSRRIVPYAMLLLGLVSLAGSAFYSSYVLAFVGLGLAFWGGLLLFLTPTKYVKLELLNAAASSSLSNTERILSSNETVGKGIYLPPKHLADYQSSLVFIPRKLNEPLPKPEETSQEKLHSKNPGGLLLTPPGLALSTLFEQKLGKSFAETNLNDVQKQLPRLFEDLEITKSLNIRAEDNTVTVELANHIFKDLCNETARLPRTHETVGCPLSSSIACALAKATGKPVTIEKEMQGTDGSTRIQYRLLEE